MPAFLDWLSARGVTYFASGSNGGPDILGVVSVGINPGCAVDQVGDSGITALRSLEGARLEDGELVRVFVDSGAFSEVEFPQNAPPKISRPITHEDWLERLAVYQELTEALGPQVYLVAPDCVAHQEETFRRQRRYAEKIVGP